MPCTAIMPGMEKTLMWPSRPIGANQELMMPIRPLPRMIHAIVYSRPGMMMGTSALTTKSPLNRISVRTTM